jgi:hypothetical protein
MQTTQTLRIGLYIPPPERAHPGDRPATDFENPVMDADHHQSDRHRCVDPDSPRARKYPLTVNDISALIGLCVSLLVLLIGVVSYVVCFGLLLTLGYAFLHRSAS